MRSKSLKAPRPGKIVQDAFPLPGSDSASLLAEASRRASEQSAGAFLRVLRAAPQGDVSAVPQVSITFSQPMVPLAEVELSDSTAAADRFGIEISPALSSSTGRWRWAGTQTLLLEPGYRLPAATKYTVTVPKGLVSATGAKLDESFSFSFQTTAPRVLRSHPSGDRNRARPVIFAQFDQDVPSGQALVGHLKLLDLRKREVPIEILSEQSAIFQGLDENDPRHKNEFETLKGLHDKAVPNRHVFFRPLEDLQLEAQFRVEVSSGFPSAEGPLKTEKPYHWNFSTYPPLRLQHHFPERASPPCSSWTLNFSTDLDLEAFDPACVSVTPEPPGWSVDAVGSSISLRGRTKGKQKYRVQINKGALLDIFGQRLDSAVDLSFAVTPAMQSLCSLHKNVEVFDPLPLLALGSEKLVPPAHTG
eukprot:TRINITY_DN16482_c0_g1_i1.p1 TRINITY_DN16482_c0_g1~~TRINITY_DN16482_c0_g1_i1.p1  ORF type:complete len:436 (-),score=61.90 TRINITY_DN16482_c0_g1_i1:1097-2350(-)